VVDSDSGDKTGKKTGEGNIQRPVGRALLLAFYVVAAPLTTIIIRYLTLPQNFGQTLCGNLTMNFYRFLAGSASILLIAWFVCREDLKRAVRNPWQLAGIAVFALVNSVYQVMYVQGIAQTSGVLAQLLLMLGPPLAILLAILVYPDERETAKGKRFFLGIVLAIGGAVGVTLGKGDLTLAYSLGSIYLFLAAVIWSASALIKKKMVAGTHPACIAGIFAAFMCVFFFISGLLWGDLGMVAEMSTETQAILLFSGVYGLLTGLGFRFLAIKLFGILKVGFAELAWPVFAGLYGYLILGELLTGWQMVFGAVLIAGCYLVMARRGAGTRRESPLS